MAEKRFLLFFLAIIGVAGNEIALCYASIPMSSPPYTSKPPKIIPPLMLSFSPSPAPYAPGLAPFLHCPLMASRVDIGLHR
ncbi:hypothetical protein CsSME_00007986 [Camellia sinensis var. sinensis]